MSDPASPEPASSPAAEAQAVSYSTPATAAADAEREGGSPLLRLAGVIGLVACMTGFLVLFAGCAGARGPFVLAPIIVFAGAGGLILSLVAAVVQGRRITEETHFLLALFVNLAAILGGLLETAVFRDWTMFPK